MRRLLGSIALASAVMGAARQTDAELITRVGAYVEQYYARVQRIVADETVVIQPLTTSLLGEGFSRRVVYELRLDWDPDADPPATIRRELLRAAGPALGPPDQPDCPEPDGVSPEPLAFLLPGAREKFVFEPKGASRLDDRSAVTIDFRPRAPERPVVSWDGNCGSFELPGRIRGRLWIDPSTAEILRLDQHLVGPTDIPGPRRSNGPLWYTVDRVDTSIAYTRVSFQDPPETLMLPSEVVSLQIIRGSGLPRLRTTQSFANYRRFVTGSRIVQP
jgi:hypothetical protein